MSSDNLTVNQQINSQSEAPEVQPARPASETATTVAAGQPRYAQPSEATGQPRYAQPSEPAGQPRYAQLSEAEEDRIIEDAFRKLLTSYLESNHRRKTEIIERAFRFAKRAHAGARRRSGEPYILHPLAVAQIVISELGLGSTSICAALLHDVVEDTEFTREDIEANFGPKIADIVEGLTKISGGIFGDQASAQAENFKKLLLSMSTDIRVVLIKMADRLHNMRTLQSMRPEKQQKIAGETLYVYAPLAHRLGLFKIKLELEDLAFRYEHPQQYEEIVSKVVASEEERTKIVEEFVAPVRKKLDDAGFKYEIKARVKSAYSIFNKMEKKKIPFEEIYDIYAVRVIFENEDDALEKLRCWQIYTFFTDGHKTHPDRLRDWTSTPKANGYRALHLTAMGPQGRWIEVQIRSQKMDEIAELGYAAHWKYKDGSSGDETEMDSWMNTIKEILANPEPNAIDFLDSIKLNLFSSEIYVFTPKGDLVTLPAGSTVLDMAFAIHTQLGTHCMAAKINHRLVPLGHKLDSGDQVEIITSKSRQPEAEWLEFCHTAKAQNALRAILRKDKRILAEKGRQKLAALLADQGVSLSSRVIDRLLVFYKLGTRQELFMAAAEDELDLNALPVKELNSSRSSLFKKLLRNPFSKKDSAKSKQKNIKAVDTKKVYLLRPDETPPNYRIKPCCAPLPGDDVIGFAADDGSVELHKVSCPEAQKMAAAYGPRIVATKWAGRSTDFLTEVGVEGIDRRGILNEITALIGNRENIDIRRLYIEAENEVFACKLVVLVDSASTVSELCSDLRRIKGVQKATRLT